MMKNKTVYCIDCGEKLNINAFYYGNKRCKFCAGKMKKGNKMSLESRKKMSKNHWSKKGISPWNKNKKYSLSKIKGENHPNWKGGRFFKKKYIIIYKPNHPFATGQGYVFEHRLVVEQQIDRYLTSQEVVHHINKIKTDNRPENLMAFTKEIFHKQFERGFPVNSQHIIFDGRKFKAHL